MAWKQQLNRHSAMSDAEACECFAEALTFSLNQLGLSHLSLKIKQHLGLRAVYNGRDVFVWNLKIITYTIAVMFYIHCTSTVNNEVKLWPLTHVHPQAAGYHGYNSQAWTGSHYFSCLHAWHIHFGSPSAVATLILRMQLILDAHTHYSLALVNKEVYCLSASIDSHTVIILFRSLNPRVKIFRKE